MASAANLGIVITAKDLASRPMKGLAGTFTDIGKTAAGVATGMLAFTGITKIFDSLGSSVIGLNAQIEQNQIAFTTMLGSGEAASGMLKELADFAAKTPFEFKDLTEGTKRLLAFGFESKEIMPMLKSIGDAASGLGLSGAEGINRIGLALGQMKAKTKVSAQEMLQMTELGVPAWDILSKAMGMSTAELMKLSEKGLVPADQAIKALTEGMAERFPNMMEKQSQSFSGLMSTLTDTLSMTVANAGKPLFDLAKQAVGGIVGALSDPAIMATINSISQAIASGVSAAVSAFGQVIGIVDAIITSFTMDAGAMGVAVGGIRKLFGDTVANAIEPFANAFMKAIPAIKQFADDVLFYVRAALAAFQGKESFGAIFGDLGDSIDRFVSVAGTYLQGLSRTVQQVFSGDFKGALSTLTQTLGAYIGELVPILAGWGKAFVEWIGPMIPPMLQKVGEVAATLFHWIVEQVPVVAEKLGVWAREFIAWVEPMIPPFLIEVGRIAEGLLDWIIKEGPPLASKLITEWVPAFLGWVGQTAIDILPKLVDLLEAIVTWTMTVGVPKLAEFGWKMGEAIVGGIVGGLGDLAGMMGRVIGEELAKIRVDVGPFHVSASGISIDLPGGSGGGGNIQEASRAAWEAAGSPDYRALAGTRAFGGPVWPGGRFLVGERGPEIFESSMPGRIIPNGGGMGINVYITVQGSVVTERDLARSVRDSLINLGRSNLSVGLS